MSLPVRGAWIEILASIDGTAPAASLPVRGAWIEIANRAKTDLLGGSLPVRGAWIEIAVVSTSATGGTVAPRTGSVD